jgi:hypothetical protein
MKTKRTQKQDNDQSRHKCNIDGIERTQKRYVPFQTGYGT